VSTRAQKSSVSSASLEAKFTLVPSRLRSHPPFLATQASKSQSFQPTSWAICQGATDPRGRGLEAPGGQVRHLANPQVRAATARPRSGDALIAVMEPADVGNQRPIRHDGPEPRLYRIGDGSDEERSRRTSKMEFLTGTVVGRSLAQPRHDRQALKYATYSS
jgi:hypothetical protein